MQTASGTVEDLVYLRELNEEGKIETVIDRSYPLEETSKLTDTWKQGRKLGTWLSPWRMMSRGLEI